MRHLAQLASTAAGGVILAVVVTACGSGHSNALYSFPNPWFVTKSIDPIGQLWSAGGIPLCTKGHSPVTITSIAPVTLRGQIHLTRILVRRVHWGRPGHTPIGTSPIGTYPGVPPGGRQPAGFVVPSPSPCRWPAETDPVYEVVVAATRTGARGGYVRGLRVRYRTGSAPGEYVIPFTYGLCGNHGPGPCSN
jgi:hypothetical protein